MDPLTITTAAAKIVNTTLQVVQTCNEYYQKYQAVDLQLVCMQTQCSIIEVALLQIQDVIMHDSARFERLRSVSVLASNYERTLGACQIVFAILKERLNKLNSHLRGNCGKPDWQLKLKVVWNDQESAMLLKNIEGQASAISLLLNAIQMKTQVEMLGLLTKKESKSILKTASDDADTLSLADENNASVGLSDGESVITSKLDNTEFDFDFEIINTAAYRKVFNKVRSKLPSKKRSQAVIPPPSGAQHGLSDNGVTAQDFEYRTLWPPENGVPESLTNKSGYEPYPLIPNHDTDQRVQPHLSSPPAADPYTVPPLGSDIRRETSPLQYRPSAASPLNYRPTMRGANRPRANAYRTLPTAPQAWMSEVPKISQD